jgi:hypothetical protein
MKEKSAESVANQPGIQIVARRGAQNALMRSAVQRRQSSDAEKLRG